MYPTFIGQDITGSTADAVKFHNTYTVAATENVKIETVKNSVNGSFEFTSIPISEAGEYVYTIREVNGSEKEITYDNTVYTVNVHVIDNLDCTFKVKYTYTKGGEVADGIIFTNVYTVPTPIPDKEPEPDFKSPQTGDIGKGKIY